MGEELTIYLGNRVEHWKQDDAGKVYLNGKLTAHIRIPVVVLPTEPLPWEPNAQFVHKVDKV